MGIFKRILRVGKQKKYEAEKKNNRIKFIIFLAMTIFSIATVVTSTIKIEGVGNGLVASIIVFSSVFTFLNYIIIYELFN